MQAITSIIKDMRSRQHHRGCVVAAVEDYATTNNQQNCCWSNMPEELLREVLVRIEASEESWPPRKYVVACGGVCRNWRFIVKEIVKFPEISGKLTFPISLKQPGPRDSLIQCFIKRERNSQTYHLYLNTTNALVEDGKFLLGARKCRRPTCTDYIISLHADEMFKGSNTYIGKLRSNFLGTKFTIYDGHPPHAGAGFAKSLSTRLVGVKQVSPRIPAGNYPVAHISYELNMLGSRKVEYAFEHIIKFDPTQLILVTLFLSNRGPRRMFCYMDTIPASATDPDGVSPTQTEFPLSSQDSFPSIPFFRSRSTRVENFPSEPLTCKKDEVMVLKNKSPRWHEQLQCWCLNFHGRVTVASVKNFQLVASVEGGEAGPENEKIILQFGKVGKDLFTMDYRYPISAFQAFAICLSSFDTKIACE